jgi:hypothetical protein
MEQKGEREREELISEDETRERLREGKKRAGRRL